MTHAGLSKVWAMVLAAVLATMLLSATVTTGARAQEPCTGQVVLDPGHGGIDSRAVNTKYGLTKKEQNLDVAKKVKTLLKGDGYTVCMTRTTDETLFE